MGSRHAPADSLGSREATGEARGYGVHSGPEAGRKEGTVKHMIHESTMQVVSTAFHLFTASARAETEMSPNN